MCTRTSSLLIDHRLRPESPPSPELVSAALIPAVCPKHSHNHGAHQNVPLHGRCVPARCPKPAHRHAHALHGQQGQGERSGSVRAAGCVAGCAARCTHLPSLVCAERPPYPHPPFSSDIVRYHLLALRWINPNAVIYLREVRGQGTPTIEYTLCALLLGVYTPHYPSPASSPPPHPPHPLPLQGWARRRVRCKP